MLQLWASKKPLPGVQIVRAQSEEWCANAWKRLSSTLPLCLSLCLTRLKCKFIQINDNITGRYHEHDLETPNHVTVRYNFTD